MASVPSRLLTVSRSLKAYVFKQLQSLDIQRGEDDSGMINPKNYRAKEPPYGWKVKEGQLVPNKMELKVCRRVVTLIRQKQSFRAVARELTCQGFKNRVGKVSWGHFTVKSIFNRWKDKL